MTREKRNKIENWGLIIVGIVLTYAAYGILQVG